MQRTWLLLLQSFGFCPNQKMPQQQFDNRPRNSTPKGNKFSTPKKFSVCSSQGSTGTSSPATTVIAGYCNNAPTGMYRTPPETPPIQNAAFGYNPSFMPPVLYRQVCCEFFPWGYVRFVSIGVPKSDFVCFRLPVSFKYLTALIGLYVYLISYRFCWLEFEYFLFLFEKGNSNLCIKCYILPQPLKWISEEIILSFYNGLNF